MSQGSDPVSASGSVRVGRTPSVHPTYPPVRPRASERRGLLGLRPQVRRSLKRLILLGLRVCTALVVSSAALGGAALVEASGSSVSTGWWRGQFPITQSFGCTDFGYEAREPWRRCPPGLPKFHDGIDVGMRCGTALIAPGRLTVVSVGGSEQQSFGPFYPRLRLPSGYDILLGHVQRTVVRPGQVVSAGSPIAYVGTFGYSTGCHLHFEVRPAGGGWGSAVEPSAFLDAAPLRGAVTAASVVAHH